jgi:hypothetical protein
MMMMRSPRNVNSDVENADGTSARKKRQRWMRKIWILLERQSRNGNVRLEPRYVLCGVSADGPLTIYAAKTQTA